MSIIKVSDERLNYFYNQNPDFDILKFNLLNGQTNNLNWENIEQETTLNLLRKYQRLLRINPNPEIAKKLLNAPSQSGLSIQSRSLTAPGEQPTPSPTHPQPLPGGEQEGNESGVSLDSAHAIASLTEEQFVKILPGDEDIARQMHKQATDIKAKTQLLWANMRDAVASPHFRAMQVSATQDTDKAALAQDIPSYQEMFGDLDYLDCEHCGSMFSPAAYFVDLMRIIDQYITEPNQDSISEAGGLTLNQRRPDLAAIELTCDNTNSLLPALEIINGILEARLRTDLGSEDGLKYLATIIYPFTLPVNFYLEQIRSYLQHLKTDLGTVYKTFDVNELAIAREQIGLSLEEYNLITNSETNEAALNKLYGIEDLESLSNVEVFLKQTGLSRTELSELLEQNLHQTELEAGLAHNFYINQVLENNQAVQFQQITAEEADTGVISTIENLTTATLDRIHRFIRLSKKLNWSFTDLDWVLTSINATEIDEEAIKKIAKLKQLQTKYKLPLDVLCSFWHDMKTIGIGKNLEKPQSLFDRVFNNPFKAILGDKFFPLQDEVKQIELNNLEQEAETNPIVGRILAALRLNVNQLIDILRAVWGAENTVDLTIEKLSQLFGISQILRLVGLNIAEYQLLLSFLDIESISTISIDQLLQITELAQWLKESKLKINELYYIITGKLSSNFEIGYSETDVIEGMKSLWQLAGDSSDQSSELIRETIASFFDIEADLAASLLNYAAIATQTPDYVKFLLTPVTQEQPEWLEIVEFFRIISRILLLTQKLELTPTELKCIAENKEAFGINEVSQLSINNIQAISHFKELIAAFGDDKNQLVEYLASVSGNATTTNIEGLANIAGWKSEQISLLLSLSDSRANNQLTDSHKTVEGITKLKQYFSLSRQVGVNVSWFTKLLNLADLPVAGASENWQLYQDASQAVREITKAKYDDEKWVKVSEKLEGELNERKRDVLTAWIVWKQKYENLRHLSQELLIDVETSSAISVSIIKEATLALQTYLHRCRMGLEAGVEKLEIPENWWQWIMNYRIWEANRKVFLYPENYLDPSLRKLKSPIFQELEEELQQSEITQESVEKAYQNYFDKFTEIAQLKPAGGYRCTVEKNFEAQDTLYLFGRTATEPYTYYYRQCINPEANNPTWEAWQKIDLVINSEHINATYAFNKLFIFWVEVVQIEKTQQKGNKQEVETATETKATIKYSFQKFGNQWIQPQTLAKDIVIDQQDIGNLWRKVTALPIPANGSEPEKILTMFGELRENDESYVTQGQNQGISLTIDLLQEKTKVILENKRSNGFQSILPAISNNRQLKAIATDNVLYDNYADYVDDSTERNLMRLRIGMVGYWSMNEGSGNIISDHSVPERSSDRAGKNNGTLQGNPQWETVNDFPGADSRKVLEFDGDGDYISLVVRWSKKPNVAQYGGASWNNLVKKVSGVTLEAAQQIGAEDPNIAFFFYMRSRMALPGKGTFKPQDAVYFSGKPSYGGAPQADAYEKNHTNIPLGNESYTIAAWIKPKEMGNLGIVGWGNSGNTNQVNALTLKPNGIRHYWWSNDLDAPVGDLTNVWHYIVATFDGTTRKIFLDGKEVARDQPSGHNVTQNNNLTIGRTSSREYFKGQIAEVSIWNVALSAEQILSASIPSIPLITKNISRSNVSISAIDNQPGWFTFDNGDEAFLAIPQQTNGFPQIDHSLRTVTEDDTNKITLSYGASDISNLEELKFTFKRISSTTIRQLSQKMLIGGLDNLLTLDSQLTPELNFARFSATDFVNYPHSRRLDFDGPNGIYFWEIFFHIPFLVANTLNSNQRFEEAHKWYHYIFNPTNPKNYPDHQGLLAYLPINEGSGNKIQERAGNNHGILQGNFQWKIVNNFPGVDSRNVLEFDGSTSFIEFANSFDNLTNFTIQLWVKPSIINDGSYHGFIGRQESPRKPGMWLAPNNGGLHYDSYSNDRERFSGTLPNFFTSTDEWLQVTWVKNAKEYSFYRNGLLFATRPAPQKVYTNPASNYHIGKVDKYWQGQIGEVRIWNVALSAEQIFDDTSRHTSDRFWRYLPFRGNILQKIQDTLTNDGAIKAYNDNPFDPHAIARLRIGAYEKAIVMKYIDNLLDWGDQLFAQDNRESINEATLLYFLAYDLLGEEPENLGKRRSPSPKTFSQIKAQYENEGDEIPQFLIDLENRINDTTSVTITSAPFNDLNTYFCAPENEQFIAYWERVEDRLYKIRHSLSIEGIRRQLALFQPPIDPTQLVRAVAGGRTPLSVVSQLTPAVPNYRFDYMLERAKSFTSTLTQLGASLLSALEKKDAEELSLLRNSHEQSILQLVTTTKEKQIEEAKESLNSLKESLASVQHRYNYYHNLFQNGLSTYEQQGQDLMISALAFQTAAAISHTISSPVYSVPTIFGFSNGGFKPADVIRAIGEASQATASTVNQGSALADKMGSYERRDEEWEFQEKLAEIDVQQIEYQIEAQNIRVKIAEQELKIHETSIEQAKEIEDFLKGKFTNQELYQWMISRLSILYFQTYKIALDMAMASQSAYQYELTKDDTFINFNYWDSLKKGLLAGESLMLGLNQLEKAYIEGNVRRFEIEKTISLLQLNPLAFQQLKNTGKCEFELSEKLFDFDFPGHYARQIKTIAVSIPAVVGPYQNISATLTQTSNKTLLKPDVNAVEYLLVGGENPPDESILRSNWRRNQKIALSRGAMDNGLFELNFYWDTRYLPFEATGAVSTWELSLPKATNRIDFDTISDVIITLSYTALDGGDKFRQDVTKLEPLQRYSEAYYFNLKQAFPGEWHTFMNLNTDSNSQKLNFNISSEIIPPHIEEAKLTGIIFKLDSSEPSSPLEFATMKIGEDNIINDKLINERVADNWFGDWVIDFDLTKVPDDLKKDGLLNPEIVKTIELILIYEGKIDYSGF